jgi:hypothetical protein
MRPLVLSLLLLSTAAQAEGLYLEGGALGRRYDLTVPGATSADSSQGRSLSGMLRLGYEINDRWAVEAGYVNHGSPGHGYRLGAQDGRLSAGWASHATTAASPVRARRRAARPVAPTRRCTPAPAWKRPWHPAGASAWPGSTWA